MVAVALLGCTNLQQHADTGGGEVESDASSATSLPSSGTNQSSSASDPTATDPDVSSTSGEAGPSPATTTSETEGGGTATASTTDGTTGEPDASTGTQGEGSTSPLEGTGSDSATESGSGVEMYEPFDFDDFDDPAGLDDWYVRSDWEGTQAQYTTLDFDGTNDGAMTIVPTTSGWYGDYDGPFVFKLVSGDFIIETYVTVTGLADPTGPPTETYNSAGLMLRNPANDPMGEDWVIHNTGYQEFGVASEGKITVDSNSILTTNPGAHFGRLRICRFAGEIAVVRWLDGDSEWTDTVAPYPDLLPDEVQAGMAVTAWNSTGNMPNFAEDPDMIAIWDYVAFYEIDDMDRCYEG